MLEQLMSHCEQRGEQQLFDKRQNNFTWLFNLPLLAVPAESLAQGSPGEPSISTPPLAAGPVFMSFLGKWQWGSGAHRLLRVWGRGRCHLPAGTSLVEASFGDLQKIPFSVQVGPAHNLSGTSG